MAENAKRNVKDFDAFWAEQTAGAKPVKYQVLGEEYELPMGLAAGVMFRIARLERDFGDQADMPAQDAMEISYDVFGQAAVDAWCTKGLLINQLIDLLVWAIAELAPQEAAQAGNRQRRRQAPAKAGSTSSRNGRS